MSSGARPTHERILEAALTHLRQTGDPAFRMQDIADAAGLTRQAIYLHFDGRADLLVQLVRYVDRKEGLRRRARRVWEAESGLAALEQFVELQAEYNPRIYPVARLLLEGRFRDEALKAAWDDRMDSRRRACGKLMGWLDREGQLPPQWEIEPAVDMLWAATSIQVWEALVVECGYSAAQYINRTHRLLHSGLVIGAD